MKIETNEILSVTDVNKNFSKATRVAENYGRTVIFKNNRPRFMLIDLDKEILPDLTDEEIIDIVSDRTLKKYKDAYLELAKW